MLSFIGFFVGKLISVTLLCIVATAISRQFISPDGYIGGFNPRLAAQLAMSGIGAVLAAHWPLELKANTTPVTAVRTAGSWRERRASCPCYALG